MTAPFWALLIILRPQTAHDVLRIAGAAIINTVFVGFLAGVHAVIVISVFHEDSGVDLWFALLITGAVTYFFWSLAMPFKRLASMLSLTTQSITPNQPSGLVANLWRRYLGGSNDRQTRWWKQRKAEAEHKAQSTGGRPEGEPRSTRRLTPVEKPVATQTSTRSSTPVEQPRGKAREAEVDPQPIYRRPGQPPTVVAKQGDDGAYNITSDSGEPPRIYRSRRPRT